MFNELFDKFLNDLETNNEESSIYEAYLKYQNQKYRSNSNARIVIDYIAGMTDDYFMKEYKTNCENNN